MSTTFKGPVKVGTNDGTAAGNSQGSLVATKRFVVSAASKTATFSIPGGQGSCLITDAYAFVVTPWTVSAASGNIRIGDGTTLNKYTAITAVSATGRYIPVGTNFRQACIVSAGGTLVVDATATGSGNTVGETHVFVEFIEL